MRLLCLVSLSLLSACAKAAPSPTPLASAAPSSSAGPKPAPRASAAPSSSAPAPTPSSSAARTTDAGSPFACVYDLPAPVESLAKVPNLALVRAIVPTVDTHMKAKTTLTKSGTPFVTACNGETSTTEWDGADWQPDPHVPPGTVHFLGSKPLPEGREAVWLATARDGGNCVSEDGYGYLAIVALSDDKKQIDVLGVTFWRPGCGPKRSLRAEKLGDETVYVETDRQSSHEGSSDFEHVYTLRNGKLVDAGQYNLVVEHVVESPAELDDAGLSEPSFTGKARFVGSEVIVKGEASWQKAAPDGGDFVVAKKAPAVHIYALVDGKLVEKKPGKKR